MSHQLHHAVNALTALGVGTLMFLAITGASKATNFARYLMRERSTRRSAPPPAATGFFFDDLEIDWPER